MLETPTAVDVTMSYETANPVKGSRTAPEVNSADSLPEATVYDLLSAERRLHVIDAIKPRRDCSRSELIDEVAEAEYGRPIEDIDARERKSIAASLYQTHLPKLADYGVISWDRETDMVGAGVRFEQVREYRRASESLGERARSLIPGR